MNMLRWKTSIRIAILLSVLAAIQIFYAFPYLENAAGFAYPVQLFETYIAAFSGTHASLLVCVIVGFILSDVPIRYRGFEFAMLRGTRKKWLIGQWAYIVLCAFVLCGFMLLLNMLISAPQAYVANEWSFPTLISSKTGKSSFTSGFLFSVIPNHIIENDSPVEAMLLTFALQFALFVFVGTLSVAVNLSYHRVVSPLVIVLLNGLHWLLRMFVPGDRAFVVVSWFSPLYHGTFSEHQFYAILEGRMASAGISALILIACSAFFILAAHRMIRKNDILNISGGDYDG